MSAPFLRDITPSFLRSIPDIREPVTPSPRRTTLPDTTNKSTGVNVLRIVQDNAAHEIQELSDEIKELETRIVKLKNRRDAVARLAEITDEYFTTNG